MVKTKQVTITAFSILASALLLVGCGNKQDDVSTLEEKELTNFESDAVDTQVKTVDGQEVTEYTMKDGSVIQIPNDVNLDDSTDSSDK